MIMCVAIIDAHDASAPAFTSDAGAAPLPLCDDLGDFAFTETVPPSFCCASQAQCQQPTNAATQLVGEVRVTRSNTQAWDNGVLFNIFNGVLNIETGGYDLDYNLFDALLTFVCTADTIKEYDISISGNTGAWMNNLVIVKSMQHSSGCLACQMLLKRAKYSCSCGVYVYISHSSVSVHTCEHHPQHNAPASA
jgi:hypothetical protein